MRWTAPPDRREITLVLFALTIFIFSYNLDTSLRFLGIDPLPTQGSYLARFGLTSTSAISSDGRKPRGWRDKLEQEVFGDWRWDEGHVAGDGKERRQEKGIGRYGALWIGRAEAGVVGGDVFGHDKAHHAVQWWGLDVPKATLVKHIPGYTIIDSAILFNGTVYIVTDNPSSFPSPDRIASWTSNSRNSHQTTDWRVVSKTRGRHVLGEYGGIIRGVSFISTDVDTRNTTLLSLWRFYTSLSPNTPSAIPSPRRLFLPHFSQFQGVWHPDIPNGVRVRSEPGWHKKTAKAAWHGLGVMYQEDWRDYVEMEVPFVLERIVVGDREAAGRGGGQWGLAPFLEEESESENRTVWLDPVRKAMGAYFDLGENREGKGGKVVITYVSRQSAGNGARLRDSDHEALVAALGKLGKGFEVNVVDELKDGWDQRMKALVRSSITLGTPNTLIDSVFMRPSVSSASDSSESGEKSGKPTVIELWPEGTWEADVQVIVGSLGWNYVGFWGDRKFTPDNLPQPSPLPSSGVQEIPVNIPDIIQAIRDVQKRP